MRSHRIWDLGRTWLGLLMLTVLSVACGGESGDTGDVLRIYTTVTQDTVDAVVGGFEEANPDAVLEVFRAPTGEVAARIAAETREGGLRADLLWMTDPLSIQQYERDGLLEEWQPDGIEAVPKNLRADSFFGTRVLNLVITASTELTGPPADWPELTEIEDVALPDPAFAGSAFAALGFFALHPDYGLDFYRQLRAGGAVQVQTPGDVVTGVAEGVYAAGISLDRTVRDAVSDGSPVILVWPESGAIALYSPIAVVTTSSSRFARPFVEHVLSPEGQEAIAGTGWQPVRGDVEWPHAGGPIQTIDWEDAFDRQEELLDDYREVFGG